MSYVVTGGAGFIGSALIAAMNANGINDIIVVDNLGSSEKWRNLRGKRIADYIHKTDFLSLIEANKLPSGVTGIVHMGACSSTTEKNLDYLMRNNFSYSTALANYAVRNRIRFVYASSAATYGDGSLGYSDDPALFAKLRPLNGYGFSKSLFDLWALERGYLNTICGFRFFNVFGPNEYHKGEMSSVVFHAWRTIKTGQSVKLFRSNSPAFKDGEQKRDFIYVKDCAEVLLNALKNPSVCGVYNLGTGQARSWLDLARGVFSALQLPEQIEFIPIPESVSKQYQNFTEAKIERLKGAGLLSASTSLEAGIADYVLNYLEKPDSYL
ncbi:MAG: ADP-glyceromanno-heptose 6-epimerase [Proteobacteria bacterium]|nr:ADP-glyceromanno-heptose 6-epimerase [Pseudomonadota bacterium]